MGEIGFAVAGGFGDLNKHGLHNILTEHTYQVYNKLTIHVYLLHKCVFIGIF